MQLRYVLSELGQGLRRNLSMHLAVVLTLLVSLTLVGLGLLFNQQATRAVDRWGSQLQITVFLCRAGDSDPDCPVEVTDAQKQAIDDVVADNPEVSSFYFESKEEAYAKVQKLYGDDAQDGTLRVTADDMPQSVWITLKNPESFEGITSAVQGLDGVSKVRDYREIIKPIIGSINLLQWVSLGTALFLVLAALLLVANTIRLAAYARRKEIGIMRLVGASTLYIALPFLMEAIVTALIGVLLAAGALGAFMYFGIEQRASDRLKFMPWIGWHEYGLAVAAIAVLGPVLTVLPTLVLTRKYLKV